MTNPGKILLINGTSSAGKSTLAQALRKELEEPFCYYASDQLAAAGFRSRIGVAEAPCERARFFDGFHRSIAAFAAAGNNLIVEHIVEEQSWAEQLRGLLAPFEVFWIGVHATTEELERREQARGDRTPGEAYFHLKTHQYCRYDIEVDSTTPIEENVRRIAAAWKNRRRAEFTLAAFAW